MFSQPWVAVCVLIAGLAGCLASPAPDLSSVFDAADLGTAAGPNMFLHGVSIDVRNGTPTIKAPIIKGMLVGPGASGERAGTSTVTLEAPKLAPPKTDPGPAGGGGGTFDLTVPAANYSVRVSLDRSADLQGYQVRWIHIQGTNGSMERSAPRSVDSVLETPVGGAGADFFLAELLKDGKVAAIVTTAYAAAVNVHWTVDSSVRPVRPGGTGPGTPKPTNYEQMADKFKTPVDEDGAMLQAETKYRGTYTPPGGTDVDLELDDPSGTCVKAVGTGGSGGTGPSTAEASEKAELGATKGTWTVRVGTLTEGGPCAGATYYNNLGTVPYQLDVRLMFG